MISYGGHLLVNSIDAPPKSPPSPQQGLFRYDGGTKWTFLGNPGGRVAALGANDGELFASGFDNALGGVFRYDGDGRWANLGAPPKVDQTYSFATFRNELHAGTWREGKVFAYPKDRPWRDVGRLGKELEVMGMAVFNGKLYGGTLPLAQVWRLDDAGWTLTGRLDFSDVEYRRAWSMAVFQGRLFCGVLPSGHVHALQAGAAVSFDRAVGEGWHHVAAMREQGRLKLFLDGKQVAQTADAGAGRLNLDAKAPLRIGAGEHATFNGALRDLRVYRRALSPKKLRNWHGPQRPNEMMKRPTNSSPHCSDALVLQPSGVGLRRMPHSTGSRSALASWPVTRATFPAAKITHWSGARLT